MHNTESLDAVARRQVTTALEGWVVESAPSSVRAEIHGLVDPIIAALAFQPTVEEFAADLQEILRSRTRARPSWAECLGAARDIVDDYRLLTLTVIDAA